MNHQLDFDMRHVCTRVQSLKVSLKAPAKAWRSCHALSGGQVKCWGANTGGKLGTGNTASYGDSAGEMGANLPAVDLGTGRTAVAISLGQDHTCALLDNGSVKCWGDNSQGQLGRLGPKGIQACFFLARFGGFCLFADCAFGRCPKRKSSIEVLLREYLFFSGMVLRLWLSTPPASQVTPPAPPIPKPAVNLCAPHSVQTFTHLERTRSPTLHPLSPP